jgi:hypothetical protein
MLSPAAASLSTPLISARLMPLVINVSKPVADDGGGEVVSGGGGFGGVGPVEELQLAIAAIDITDNSNIFNFRTNDFFIMVFFGI